MVANLEREEEAIAVIARGVLIRGARVVPARSPTPSEPIPARISDGLSGRSPVASSERGEAAPIVVSNLCLAQVIGRDLAPLQMTCDQRIHLR